MTAFDMTVFDMTTFDMADIDMTTFDMIAFFTWPPTILLQRDHATKMPRKYVNQIC